jgi:1-acyl-sn-glycerol-3-phosphate acyltransferase
MGQQVQGLSTEDERRLVWMNRVRRMLRFVLRYEVFGAEGLPEGGFIIASNHRSLLDALYMFAAFDRDMVFVAANGVFKVPLLGRLLEWMGCIRAYRHQGKSPEARQKTLNLVAAAVQHSRIVVIYPEGGIITKRTLKKRPYQITRSIAELLNGHNCTVVPVVVLGARYSLLKVWRKVEITVHSPLLPGLSEQTVLLTLSGHFQSS